MFTTLCLFTCALVTAQPGDGSDWLLIPQLSRGQELVYSGSFTEEVLNQGVQLTRTYRLESRVFVLDTMPQGAEVAFLTMFRLRPARAGHANEAAEKATQATEPLSVRLELARVDLQGHVAPESGTTFAVPLEGPATVECGGFVEVPGTRVGRKKTWEVAEENRPPRTWQLAGTETVAGTPCLKLVGLQQSPDWDRPRADSTAWRRRDTVWISPRLGFASRLERTIERREPAHREPTQRSVLTCELDSSLVYPGALHEDCRREILRARNFAEAAQPLLREPGKQGHQAFESLLAKIQVYLEKQPPTPYREAVLQIQRRLEAGLRGESSPSALADEPAAATTLATFGQQVPDFAAPDLANHSSIRLSRFLGRPILLVFYNPQSQTAGEVLHFAQEVAAYYGPKVWVLGMAISDDPQRVLQQRADLHLTFPVLSGNGLQLTYVVESTPKLMVLDADGILRGSYIGWGRETPREVALELQRWLNPEIRTDRAVEGRSKVEKR